MKKNIDIAVLIICMLFASATITSAEGTSFTLYSNTLSKYLGGNGLVFYDQPVLQGGLTATLPNGLYSDIWGSVGLDGKPGFGREFDATLGYANRIGVFDYDVGVLYIHITPKNIGDVVSPFFKIQRTFSIATNHAFAPFVKLELYFPISANSPQRGIITSIGANHSWAINDLWSVSNTATLKLDNGAFGFNSAALGEYKANLSWQITKSLSLKLPDFKVMTPLTHVNDGRKTAAVIGAGFAYNFDWK